MGRPKKLSVEDELKLVKEQLRFIKKQLPEKKMGRKPLLDEQKIKTLTTLCGIPWITLTEVCKVLDLDETTIEKFLRRKYDTTFSGFKDKNVISFKVWLWGKEIDLIKDKHAGVTIFMGKNYLGQSDKQETIINDKSEPTKLIIKMAD
jgi:hypothetical protein